MLSPRQAQLNNNNRFKLTIINNMKTNDWRINLFGNFIQENQQLSDLSTDEETPVSLVPTSTALDTSKYDYIAVFFGAEYCPHCRALAPKVVESAKILEVEKRCKVLFVSNDRDTEAFQTSVSKKTGIDVMPYNLERTKAMRDVFKLTTIPALMILKNDNLDRAAPTVITNARHAIEADPKAQNFPWASIHSSSSVNEVGPNSGAAKAETMSLMDRLIIRGKYGKWWELGHHANPNKPQDMFMDEHAVRIRAGLLNIITWIALINIFFWRKPIFVKVLYPLVGFEFISSALIGLTPVAPLGTLATFIAFVLHPEPFWKPAKPKRFAWLIGLSLATACLVLFTFRKDMDWEDYRPAIGFVVAFCNLATWLEGNAGFCLGCFIYNSFLVPMMHLDECSECKL